MRYLPVGPAVDAATHALARHGEIASVRDLALLAGWLAAGIIGSLAFFRGDPSRVFPAEMAAAQAV